MFIIQVYDKGLKDITDDCYEDKVFASFQVLISFIQNNADLLNIYENKDNELYPEKLLFKKVTLVDKIDE